MITIELTKFEADIITIVLGREAYICRDVKLTERESACRSVIEKIRKADEEKVAKYSIERME